MTKKVALVLSSGGARGLAHIGVIEELQHRGYTISTIAGSSMGALIGGIHAAGELDVYKDWVTSLEKKDVISLLDFTISAQGIIKGERVLNKMKSLIPDRQIENLPVPFTAISTDIDHNKEIIHRTGSLYEAIRASISIPTIFMPYHRNGTHLVDGGVLNPMPLNRVARNGDDLLVGVNVNFRKLGVEVFTDGKEMPRPEPHKDAHHPVLSRLSDFIPKSNKDKLGYFNLMNKAIGLALNRIATLTIEKYPPDMLINIDRFRFGTYDFHRAAEIIDEGRQKAAQVVDVYEDRVLVS